MFTVPSAKGLVTFLLSQSGQHPARAFLLIENSQQGLCNMFVQSKATTFAKEKNGLALRQRREQETLVQWENGDQRWVETLSLWGNSTCRQE